MNKPIHSFRLCLDMGDMIYSLLFAKTLNVSQVFIDYSRPELKFNQKSAEFLFPLIKYQPYLSSVEYYSGQEYDCDYALHPKQVPVVVGTNLTHFHASKFNMENDARLNEAWLEAPKEQSPSHRVVINRTSRYHGNSAVYEFLLSNVYLFKQALFVGLPEEHEAFQQDFSVSIPFRKTDNALELAKVINSAETFLGNESLACSIATGLGKTMFVEVCPCAANYIFLQRPNTFYF